LFPSLTTGRLSGRVQTLASPAGPRPVMRLFPAVHLGGRFLVECRRGREPTHSCGVPFTSDGYQMEEPGLQSLKPIEGAAFVYGHLLDSTYFKRAYVEGVGARR